MWSVAFFKVAEDGEPVVYEEVEDDVAEDIMSMLDMGDEEE